MKDPPQNAVNRSRSCCHRCGALSAIGWLMSTPGRQATRTTTVRLWRTLGTHIHMHTHKHKHTHTNIHTPTHTFRERLDLSVLDCPLRHRYKQLDQVFNSLAFYWSSFKDRGFITAWGTAQCWERLREGLQPYANALNVWTKDGSFKPWVQSNKLLKNTFGPILLLQRLISISSFLGWTVLERTFGH